MASTRDALKMLSSLPRVSLGNIRGREPKKAKRRLKRQCGRGDRGQGRHGTLPRLGFEGGQTPFYLRIPKEPYYKEHSQRKEYVPVTLLQLQRMIDLGRVDITRPVDIAALCNTKLIHVAWEKKQYGIHITSEGADQFDAQINLEVQWIDETALAALERAGSSVTTRYYDPKSLNALSNPLRFFQTGSPIPTAKTPTSDVLAHYTNPQSRGYLVQPDEIEIAKQELAQKYGYEARKSITESVEQLLKLKKDKLQVFHGLEAGWIVNLQEQFILKPQRDELKNYYSQETML